LTGSCGSKCQQVEIWNTDNKFLTPARRIGKRAKLLKQIKGLAESFAELMGSLAGRRNLVSVSGQRATGTCTIKIAGRSRLAKRVTWSGCGGDARHR